MVSLTGGMSEQRLISVQSKARDVDMREQEANLEDEEEDGKQGRRVDVDVLTQRPPRHPKAGQGLLNSN